MQQLILTTFFNNTSPSSPPPSLSHVHVAAKFTWTRRASLLLAETSTYFTVFLANPVQKAQIYALRGAPQVSFTFTAKIWGSLFFFLESLEIRNLSRISFTNISLFCDQFCCVNCLVLLLSQFFHSEKNKRINNLIKSKIPDIKIKI